MNFYFLNSAEKLTKEQVGGKGFYLHQMAKDGLPVPVASFLTTKLWKMWSSNPKLAEKSLKTEIIPKIIEYFKNNNGDQMPLVSVRSAGAVSMPGMMDTILNVGEHALSESDVSLKKQIEFKIDSYTRFLTMYGETVEGISKEEFKNKPKFKDFSEVEKYFKKIYSKFQKNLPSKNLEDQLFKCIIAVFESWNSERAILYRKINNISNDSGTAIVIQQMVFGNKNDLSSSGVMFSRNPSNGQNKLTGEYLTNAQGEDVVSGAYTPKNLDELKAEIPEAFEELKKIAEKLELKYKQMQDIEFTIEDGKVFILQARTAKCSPFAKLKMLMDMYKFNEITATDVLDNLSLKEYLNLNIKQVDESYNEQPAGTGLPASMGAISGRVVFGASSKYDGEPTIFCAKETTPNDLRAIQMATGILTASGGMTSHAAVVARGMGKVCIVGCNQLKIYKKNGAEEASLGDNIIKSGDWITIDASSGKIWIGRDVPILDAQNTQIFWDLEDLVFKTNPKWTRIVSKVDELYRDKKTYFLTYALETGDDNFLQKELKDSTEYLTGILDLTGKMDFLQQKYKNQFLFADVSAEKMFLKKKKILKDVSCEPGPKDFDFEIYLGPYEKEHSEDFKRMGYKVIKSNDVAFDLKNSTASLIVSQYIDKNINNKNFAISSGNALRGLLK